MVHGKHMDSHRPVQRYVTSSAFSVNRRISPVKRMLFRVGTNVVSRDAKFVAKTIQRFSQPRRSKRKWVTAESSALKNDPTRLALNQFDQQYGAQFKKDWPSIRLALLSLQKYGALMNNFCDADEIMKQLSGLGAQDFVQPLSHELREAYAKMETEALERKRFESDAEDGRYEYANEYTDESEISKSEEMREEMRTGSQLTHADGTHSQAEVEDGSDASTGGNMVGRRSEVESSWKDEYIVAAGFESKLEYMLGKEETYEHTDSSDAISVEKAQVPIRVSHSLRCLVHPQGRFDRFPPSKADSVHRRLLHYTLDASSLLPVIALDIQPSDSVLDMCAAPGGKSLAMLNVLEKGGIILNEPSTARRKRLESVLESYVPQEILNSGEIQVTSVEGERWGSSAPNTFDKILVDVPCTTDRLSVKERDNNIFSGKRNKERWDLPSLQEVLLCSALLSVKPGGDVVYSTCSLSSLQNDGVVQGAIRTCQEEFHMAIQVIDLSPLASCCSTVFKFSGTTRYGQLVIPEISKNFGPMYFARLRKISST